MNKFKSLSGVFKVSIIGISRRRIAIIRYQGKNVCFTLNAQIIFLGNKRAPECRKRANFEWLRVANSGVILGKKRDCLRHKNDNGLAPYRQIT